MIAARRPRRPRDPGPGLILAAVLGPVAVGAVLLGASIAAILAALALILVTVWVLVLICDQDQGTP